LTGLRKEVGQLLKDIPSDPAGDSLPGPLHADEARLSKLLEMVGDRGWGDLEILGKIPYTGTHTFFCAARGSRPAAGDQLQEELQSVRVRQGPKGVRESIDAVYFTVRHVSNIQYVLRLSRGIIE
jgi:hypothetical protein